MSITISRIFTKLCPTPNFNSKFRFSSKQQSTIREKFEDYIRKEEDKMDELFKNIIMGLSQKFDKLEAISRGPLRVPQSEARAHRID